MPIISLHDGGWFSLPAEARGYLDVANGDRLDVEIVNGALVLRPAKLVKKAATPVPRTIEDRSVAAPVDPTLAQAVATPPKRRPGRPRKQVA